MDHKLSTLFEVGSQVQYRQRTFTKIADCSEFDDGTFLEDVWQGEDKRAYYPVEGLVTAFLPFP